MRLTAGHAVSSSRIVWLALASVVASACTHRVQGGAATSLSPDPPATEVVQVSAAGSLLFFGASARTQFGTNYSSGALGLELSLPPLTTKYRGRQWVPSGALGAHVVQYDHINGEGSTSFGSPYLTGAYHHCRIWGRADHGRCLGGAVTADYRIHKPVDNAWFLGLALTYTGFDYPF